MGNEKNYKQITKDILSAIGGKENIIKVSHCVSRLRFELRDEAIVKVDEAKKIPGVLSAQFSGKQFQVIIGTDVDMAYDEFCKHIGFQQTEIVHEDTVKPKKTVKVVLNKALSAMVNSMTPVLPIIVCGGMLKTIIALFGPTMLGWIPEGSGFYTIISFAGSAAFYFMPVFVGYYSAKQFNCSPALGMFFGTILVSPVLVEMAVAGSPLDFLGIPVTVVKYSNSVLPIILITWIMSYVEHFIKKHMPNVIQLFVPFATILVMLPVGLCLLAPLGNFCGQFISSLLLWIHSVIGPVAVGLVGATFLILIMTGMHHTINFICITNLAMVGYDNLVGVGAAPALMATIGVALAFSLKTKKVENKSLGWSSFLMIAVGGLSEPTIYGVLLPYKKMLLAQIIGGLCGGMYLGLMGVKMYTRTGANILLVTRFIGGSTQNVMHGLIGSIIALVMGFVLVFFLKFDEK